MKTQDASKIKTPMELGSFIKTFRESQNMTQLDVAGLANTGNRLIVDIEKGKPTVQIQMILKIIDLLGLEIIIQRKGE